MKMPNLDSSPEYVKYWFFHMCESCSSYAANWPCSGACSEKCLAERDAFLEKYRKYQEEKNIK